MRSWENDGSLSDLGTERGTGCRRMRACPHLGVNEFGIHIPGFLSVESLLLQRSSFFGVERTPPPHMSVVRKWYSLSPALPPAVFGVELKHPF